MTSLRLYAQGKAFQKDKFSLRETIELLDTTRMMLDTGLVVAIGKERLPADLKDNINYEITIKTGSIDAYITIGEIASSAIPLLAPIAADIPSYLETLSGIIKRAKILIEWLGTKRNNNAKVDVRVNLNNSPRSVVLVATDGDNFNATQTDFNAALRLFRPLKNMSEMCDGDKVASIEYYDFKNGKETEKSFFIDPSTKEYYKSETLIEDLMLPLVATIYDLNTKNGKGKLETANGENYSMRLAPTIDVHKFSNLAYDKGPIECLAKPIMKVVNGMPTLSGYEIIEFKPPSQSEMKFGDV